MAETLPGFLTLHQPFATLIAVGTKTIETRGNATRHRGPLIVHAGKSTESLFHGDHYGPWRVQCWDDTGWHLFNALTERRVDLPLGAAVATCDLTDCLPVVKWEGDREKLDPSRCLLLGWEGREMLVDNSKLSTPDVSDQIPYGIFTPGRYGLLLDHARPLPEPIPWRGVQGLRSADPMLARMCGL